MQKATSASMHGFWDGAAEEPPPPPPSLFSGDFYKGFMRKTLK